MSRYIIDIAEAKGSNQMIQTIKNFLTTQHNFEHDVTVTLVDESFQNSHLNKYVVAWARHKNINALNYGSPYHMWRTALAAEVITDEEFLNAENHYGDMFHYVGD